MALLFLARADFRRLVSELEDAMRRLVALGTALGFGLPLLACGGGHDGRGPELPVYGDHAAELFDDAIEPSAVGYPQGVGDPAGNPMADKRLRERTQTGDAVVRARVTTVTSKAEEGGPSWQIGLHTVERLAGSAPLESDFTLSVAPTDTAAGIVRAFEGRLIGTAFIAFVRQFARPGAPPGEAGDLRFHLAADSSDEQNAVKAALLLAGAR
jgi:hypothetical protein